MIDDNWQARVYGGASGSNSNRRLPVPAKVRRQVMAEQRNRCFYCELPFGSTIYRRGLPVRLGVQWDHYMPFAYLALNPADNWRAACQVCNHIKGACVFTNLSLDEVRRRVAEMWARAGYREREWV